MPADPPSRPSRAATAGTKAAVAARRWACRLWPDTLFGQLVLILASGMLAAQFLTSSIWLNVRYQQLLEAPTRVLGDRVADLLGLLARGQSLEVVRQELGHDRFIVWQRSQPREAMAAPGQRARDVQNLLDLVVHERLPQAGAVSLSALRLHNERGAPANWLSMLGFEPLVIDYALQIEYGDGQWLWIDASLPQGWLARSGWAVLWDLLWRVYLVRIIIVVALVMLAVKWVVDPLARLARAAQAAEADVAAAPAMAERGPREVRHAAQAFNHMQQRIAASMAERTRFLAAVSHDLRSPITRMRLRLELLEGPELEPVKDKLRADLASMESLIDGTLAFIQSGQRGGRAQCVDVDSLVRSACQDWQELGADVQWRGGTGGGQIEGHAQSLRRALDNLIDNALRYAGQARVELARRQSEVEIRVTDDGPGIAPALLEQVRQPFVRGESSRNPATGGHGLGLSIVDGVAQGHGGQLHLDNREGASGLVARLVLPLRTGNR